MAINVLCSYTSQSLLPYDIRDQAFEPGEAFAGVVDSLPANLLYSIRIVRDQGNRVHDNFASAEMIVTSDLCTELCRDFERMSTYYAACSSCDRGIGYFSTKMSCRRVLLSPDLTLIGPKKRKKTSVLAMK